MDAFESALESLDIILCDENIFTVTKWGFFLGGDLRDFLQYGEYLHMEASKSVGSWCD